MTPVNPISTILAIDVSLLHLDRAVLNRVGDISGIYSRLIRTRSGVHSAPVSHLVGIIHGHSTHFHAGQIHLTIPCVQIVQYQIFDE